MSAKSLAGITALFFGTACLGQGVSSSPTAWLADAGPNLLQINPTAIAAADLDGDEDLDAVVGYGPFFDSQGVTSPQPLQILINDGTGLQPGPQLPEHNVVAMAVTDVTGDGRPDIVLATDATGISTDSENTIYTNNGNGSFSVSGTLGRDNLTALALGDIDLDGDLDAVTATTAELTLWLNQGGQQNGTFGELALVQTSLIATGDVVDVAIGDLGQGLFPDVYVAIEGAADRIFYNVSGGALADIGPGVGNTSSGRSGVALADLDGNAELDVVTVSRSGETTIDVFLRNGDALSSTGQQFRGSGENLVVAAGDLDGDLRPDLLVGERGAGSGASNVWLNRGNGLLDHSGQCFGDHDATTAVALIDINQDGSLDALIAGSPLLDVSSGQPIAGQTGTSLWLNGAPVGEGDCCPLEFVNEASRTAGPAQPGVVPKGVGGPLADIDLLFEIRDRFMLPRHDGARLAGHYVDFGSEIVGLFLADPQFHLASAERYAIWQPALRALQQGTGDSATVDSVMTEALDSFLSDLASRGGSALQQMITEERSRIDPISGLAGLTMNEFVDRTMGLDPMVFADGFEE